MRSRLARFHLGPSCDVGVRRANKGCDQAEQVENGPAYRAAGEGIRQEVGRKLLSQGQPVPALDTPSLTHGAAARAGVLVRCVYSVVAFGYAVEVSLRQFDVSVGPFVLLVLFQFAFPILD